VLAKRKFDFESFKDFSGHAAAVLALVGMVAFTAGVLILRRDDMAEPRYWNVYNTLFAIWILAELGAFGLGFVTITNRLFGEWGESKLGLVLAIIAVIVSVTCGMFLLIVLYTFYFGGGQFTLI
jgi:hypothetical protein